MEMNAMKRLWIVLPALLFAATAAWSQSGSGQGTTGPGQGTTAPGPGMMGGYGPGPGMMGGHGMGPGMMGGYGMGPGMMWGPGNWERIPNLSNEQRTGIAAVEKEFRQKQWQLMEKMHELHFQSGATAGKFDEQAARKNYDAMAALRKQMFEYSLDEQKRIDAILTPQQREQLQRSWGGG